MMVSVMAMCPNLKQIRFEDGNERTITLPQLDLMLPGQFSEVFF